MAANVTRAVMAQQAPAIDGSDADDVWGTAMTVENFRMFQPVENGEPRFRTQARVAYDDANIYVFVRAFDPHPDSIIALLSRRDVRTQSDQIKIMIDSYHDRRSGYEFAVNPAGVKRDYYTYDDSREDASWDAVWDVATKIDSLGWTAEFRIPLSQLRFPHVDANTFGFMVMRDIARTNERLAWPVYYLSKRGIASQYGEITDLRGLNSPRRLEVVPYAVTKNVTTVKPNSFGRSQQQSAGMDLKFGLASNLTLSATVNPDFGQVEADPAVLNLTSFESFFEERRPFFLESTGIFQFGGGALQLFYPRRIGRAPQLGGLANDQGLVPGATTILGAAKLTGRLSGGTEVGAIAAMTQRESVEGTVVEPRTSYGVARVSHDFRKGESGIGAIVTAVDRDLPGVTANFLRRSALIGGIDGRHRFGNGTYSLTGSIAASNVTGSASAIGRTQRSSVHLYQRPDSDLPYDTTRTSLAGTGISAAFDKVSGVFRGGVNLQRLTPGFESNDVGFLSAADQQTANLYAGIDSRKPQKYWKRAQVFANLFNTWNAAGMPTGRTPEIDLFAEMKNSSTWSANLWTDNFGPVYCDRCARGGPAVRVSPSSALLINWSANPRQHLLPSIAAIYNYSDGGRSRLWRVRPYLTWRAASNASFEIGTRYQKNIDNTQWYANVGKIGSPDAHYLFAHLDQDLLSFTSRLNYTATPTLSLQLYAEPFVTTGQFSNVREFSSPRSANYDNRFKPYDLGEPAGGFNEKQFHSNMVVRWEYRPGSTLFFVWSQGRNQDDRNPGSFLPVRD
ncbi:MAG TPA: DUF5916 domain-containing protein, partial [Gemmatimonadaceae bacterium]|nr:DUF5916 domain-containing protein [Gemmatimonadaceae bacterium]